MKKSLFLDSFSKQIVAGPATCNPKFQMFKFIF